MEILIVAIILVFILIYTKVIDEKKLLQDTKGYFNILREDDYNFLVAARYGEDTDPDVLFQRRVYYGLGTIFVVLFFSLNDLSLLNIIISIAFGFVVYRMPYQMLKNYYKNHLHQIDVMLPYYLKGLEILIQHYTVPVAIGKSVDDAPDLFKPGLKRLIEKINAGDSTIDPYMDFANEYPVRDSMRMMRLLYRLGIGGQERKQERLLMFSKSVSSLQAKARETKYKERLNHMEQQTMLMLIVTGVGLMIVILMSMFTMMGQ